MQEHYALITNTLIHPITNDRLKHSASKGFTVRSLLCIYPPTHRSLQVVVVFASFYNTLRNVDYFVTNSLNFQYTTTHSLIGNCKVVILLDGFL